MSIFTNNAWDDVATWNDADIWQTFPISATITVAPERTAMVGIIPTGSGTGLPTNSPTPIKAPLDPSDETMIAIDFSNLIAPASIASITSISLDAAAMALGVSVDTDNYRPRLDVAKSQVGIYLIGDPALVNAAQFSGVGINIGITVSIETDETPPSRYQRTISINERQL